MDRRNFIKTSICAGCAAAIAVECKNFIRLKHLSDNKPSDFDNPEFIYNSNKDLPKKVKLETCTLCQLQCPQCLRVTNMDLMKKTVGLGYIKFEDFKKFVDDNSFEEIEISNYGEIFLNPDLKKIIEYAFKKDIKLTAYTGVNLNTLSDEMAEALVKYRFGNMVVSIDGATPETYAIYRRGGDFNKVIENIKKINFYKKKYNSKDPELTYKFILFGHNEHEILKAKKLAKSLGMKMKFDTNYAPEYSPVKNAALVKKLTGLKDISNEVGQSYYRYLHPEKDDIPWFFCSDLFRSPQINYNGDLLGCCVLFENKKYINVFDVGLKNALNSEEIRDMKKLVTNISITSKQDVPCKTCHVYEWMKKNNKYIIV